MTYLLITNKMLLFFTESLTKNITNKKDNRKEISPLWDQ